MVTSRLTLAVGTSPRRCRRREDHRILTPEGPRSAPTSTATANSGKGNIRSDEIPDAYKDIDQVMADAADLVEVRHVLRQIVNVKGD